MKILMTTMKLEIGGAETHIVELSRELRRRGYDITVASNGGVYVEELEREGIKHVRLPLHNKRLSSVLRSYFGLKKLIKTGGFDIIHAHARIPAYLCGILARKYGVRFMTSAHWVFKVNALWKKLADWGERSVAVSYDIKQYLIDNYGVCADNISVTINGIDTEKFSASTDPAAFEAEFSLEPSTARKHGSRVVCVSRIDRDRSLAPLLLCKAAPELKKRFPAFELVIVGSGDDNARLTEYAAAANAENAKAYITLCGARTDINCAIASGDIFVGVSRAALEAMAAEKPCVIAGNEGYIGIFDESKLDVAFDTNFCCRGCEPTTAEVLIRDLSALLAKTPEQLAGYGRYNRALIMKVYSAAKMADDYESAYKKLAPYHAEKDGGIILSGYYGYRNSGDDALLGVIVSAIRGVLPEVRITALSKTPKQTARQYGIDSVRRFDYPKIKRLMKRSRLFINGGGTLLTNAMTSTRSLWYYSLLMELAKRSGLKVMLYANGIGPFKGEYGKKLAKSALEKTDIISLRDKISMTELAKLGVGTDNAEITADPAFALESCDEKWLDYICEREKLEVEGRYFCFTPRRFDGVPSDYLDRMTAVCAGLKERFGLTPVIAAMQRPKDTALCAELASRTSGLFLSELTASELIGIISRCDFTVGMRLHSLIYSAAAGVPVIALSYDVKVDALAGIMNSYCEPEYAVRVLNAAAPDTGAVISAAEAIERDRAGYIENIKRAAAGLKARSLVNADYVVKLTENNT